jgi:hypothetical protein
MDDAQPGPALIVSLPSLHGTRHIGQKERKRSEKGGAAVLSPQSMHPSRQKADTRPPLRRQGHSLGTKAKPERDRDCSAMLGMASYLATKLDCATFSPNSSPVKEAYPTPSHICICCTVLCAGLAKRAEPPAFVLAPNSSSLSRFTRFENGRLARARAGSVFFGGPGRLERADDLVT